MNHRESLVAEIQSARQLLDMIPPDQVLDRATFESRIAHLEKDLEFVASEREVPRVDLFFDGDPVVGTRGIESTFAAAVIDKYSQAVQARAAELRGRLKPMGPMPMRGVHQLFVAKRLAGSFGFSLEALQPDLAQEDSETLTKAIASVDAVIEGSLEGDRALSDAIGSTQQRVLSLVREFLSKCAGSRAFFRIKDQDREINARGPEQVQDAANRLESARVEEVVRAVGWLRGVLPETRKFEFEEDNDSRSIRTGGIGEEIDPDAINEIDKTCLHKKCRATFRVSRVGQSQSWVRYVLTEIEPLKGDSAWTTLPE